MIALRGGDPGSAFAALKLYQVETGGAGQLAEDAAAYEIEALCRVGDKGVAGKLEAFDRRFPRSAKRSRLDVRCP